MQHDYLTEEVKLDLDRGVSTKKHWVQEWNTFSPSFSLEEPLQSHTDMVSHWNQTQSLMSFNKNIWHLAVQDSILHVNLNVQSLQFGQWRAAELSQDCFRAQNNPSRDLFNQSQTFTQHAAPILRAPTWLDHPVNSYSQQRSLSTGESLKSVHLDRSRISQQCTEETDLNFIYESRKQETHKPSFGGSRFWSHQQQVQDERERWAPLPFSASYLSEGFQYEPFVRCPHPYNTQHRSDRLGMTHCPRSVTPFYPPLYL